MENSIKPSIQEILQTIISQVIEVYSSEPINYQEQYSPLNNSKILNIEQDECLFEGVKINNIECYKQINSDICGFHCLFNLFQFIRFLFGNSVSIYQSLKNGANFWKFYFHLFNDLLLNFPNKAELKSLQNLGPLDRIHMDYILNNYKDLLNIQTILVKNFGIETFIQPFLFGFGIIQNSDDELKKIQDFAGFIQKKKHEKTFLAIFPLGITIHWSLFVILVNEEIFQYFYLDSKNVKLNYILNNEISEAIKEIVRDA